LDYKEAIVTGNIPRMILDSGTIDQFQFDSFFLDTVLSGIDKGIMKK
jgi:hypothetical protein